MREFGTSIRDGALQLWPELSIIVATPARDSLGEVRVFEDDVRALATQFLGHPLDRRRRVLGDVDAGAGRPGERDHVDVGMARHGHAHPGTVAVDQVVHARGHARGMP